MEDMSKYYFKNISCPHCDNAFSALKVKMRYFRVIQRFPDFGAIYENNFSPYLYEIVVCPNCGYSWDSESDELLMPAHKRRLEKILQRWRPMDYNTEPRSIEVAIMTFQRALLCDQLRQAKCSSIARKEVHLAWIYRGLGDKENEQRFLVSARENYRKALSTEDLWSEQNGSEILATYMTAVLSYYTGDMETCKRWLSRVIFNHPEADLRPSVLHMARELWYDIREKDWSSSISEIEALSKSDNESQTSTSSAATNSK